jgi:hypothetical protein
VRRRRAVGRAGVGQGDVHGVMAPAAVVPTPRVPGPGGRARQDAIDTTQQHGARSLLRATGGWACFFQLRLQIDEKLLYYHCVRIERNRQIKTALAFTKRKLRCIARCPKIQDLGRGR